MKDLSIIIVSYKGWGRLIKCLEALDSFTGERFKSEVIVVDNRSDDDTIFEIEKKFPNFRFVHNEVNGGFANGCNLGAKSAVGRTLLFLNPDTIASENALEKLISVSDMNPDFGIVSCSQVNEKGKESVAWGQFPRLLNLTGLQRAIFKEVKKHVPKSKNTSSEDIIFPDWVSGSVVLMPKEAFIRVNGFDEDFWMYFEDVDLCRRVRDIGLEVAFCKNVFIEHNHGGSSRINLKTASLTKTEVHISRHVYIGKHKRSFDRILIQTFMVINNLITTFLAAILGAIFFFIPKLLARTLIFSRLAGYYARSLYNHTWISSRSVNFHRRNSM